MKKKTLNIILASTLLTSALAISFPAVYISVKNNKNNSTDNNQQVKPPLNGDSSVVPPTNDDNILPPNNVNPDDNNPSFPNQPDDGIVPPIGDNNTNPDVPNNPDNGIPPSNGDNNIQPEIPSNPDNELPPTNGDNNTQPDIPNDPNDNITPPETPEENNSVYLTELNNIANNNQNIKLKNSSSLLTKQPSSVVNDELTLSEMQNFIFNSSLIDKNKLKFTIVSSNDSKGTLTAKLKYENNESTNLITISGFKKVNEQQNQDLLMAQRIFESNRTVNIKNYKNVSKTIPMFFKNEDEREKFKTDELKNYFNLPEGANWNKVSFSLYTDRNNEGILKMLVRYGNEIYNEPISFTGFQTAQEWVNNLVDKNSALSMKELNKYKPSQFYDSQDNDISIDQLSSFVDAENVPDVTIYRDNAFKIVPTSTTNDDAGSLKAKFQIWFDSSTKVESDKTITIDNFERTISIAERFAKFNPEVNVLELLKRKDVIVYDQGINYLTYLKKTMASQTGLVQDKMNNAVFEIPWKLKNKKQEDDISKSVIIKKLSNNINDIADFPINIYFDVVNNSADDRYGTVELYVKTKYSDGSFSTLKSDNNKIKLKGLLDYSLIGVQFIDFNPKLYIKSTSPLYNKDPKTVDLTTIKMWSESGNDSDVEMYVVVERWLPMLPKLKLVPAKDEKGNLLVNDNPNILKAQVQIDGINNQYPTSYRYIEVIWDKNDSNNNQQQ